MSSMSVPTLPLPVQHRNNSVSSTKRIIRFPPPLSKSFSFPTKWAAIKRKFTPSAPSESVADVTDVSESEEDAPYSNQLYRERSSFSSRHSPPTVLPLPLLRNSLSTSVCSPSGIMRSGGGGHSINAVVRDEEEEAEFVVIENTDPPEYWGLANHASSEKNGHLATDLNTVVAKTASAGESIRHQDHPANSLNWFRARVWPLLLYFFNPRYATDAEEESFLKERWHTNKTTALSSAAFLIITWSLSFATPRPWSNWNEIETYILGPCFSLPIVPAILFDFPRRRPLVWQTMLTLCAWLWPIGNIVDMRLCDYYGPYPTCQSRDFQGTLYFASAVPTIALFALGQSRLFATLATVTWLTVTMAAIVPVRNSYLRNTTNIALYHSFIIYTHFRNEISDRRMWTLRAELKVQFKAKQKAQIEEKKANDSKRRFTSYVFHELRVPLNTALLAVQNLEGTSNRLEDSELEHSTLRSSFKMMSQVLNDVLDFTRMERGGFSTVSRPFSFITVMNSLLLPLQLDAASKGLELETVLDPKIEAAAEVIMGDELRLRQVINNLTSNACKFTPEGGKVKVVTSLVYVTPEPTPGRSAESPMVASSTSTATTDVISSDSYKSSSDGTGNTSTAYSPRLSTGRLKQHDDSKVIAERRVVVIRIEIIDSGVGIKSRDLADHRLFSAYVQTEIGRTQGGKGSGLGLSIVRQIIMLSGGRLGVKSLYGKGSTFWCELAFPIGVAPGVIPINLALTSSPTMVVRPTLSISQPAHPPSYLIDPSELLVESLSSRSASASSTAPFSSLHHHASTSSTASRHHPLESDPMNANLDDPPLRVLIVDDDSLTRRLMSRMMTRLGCIASSAENGQVALDMILRKEEGGDEETEREKKHFDIIFLDNQMPIKSGLEVAQKMRSLNRDDLIVGVTANALLSDQDQYLRCGASFVLTKPVAEVDLKKMLQVARERRRQ